MKKTLLYIIGACALIGLGASLGGGLNKNNKENISQVDNNIETDDTAETEDNDKKTETDSKEEKEETKETEEKKEKVYLKIKDIKISSDSIGTPEISVVVKNTGKVDIDAYDVKIKCYDKYDKLLSAYGFGEEYFVGTSQDDVVKSKKTLDNDRHWSLYGFETACKYEVAIIKYHDTDGNTKEISEEDLVWVTAEK